MTTLTDTPIVLWQLHKHGKRFTCAVRLTLAGLRLEQSIGDQRLVSQTCHTERDLYALAKTVKRECLADGWHE